MSTTLILTCIRTSYSSVRLRNLQKFAEICRNLQKFAEICRNLKKFAEICRNLQKFAEIGIVDEIN